MEFTMWCKFNSNVKQHWKEQLQNGFGFSCYVMMGINLNQSLLPQTEVIQRATARKILNVHDLPNEPSFKK